jgi:hypothetical protein
VTVAALEKHPKTGTEIVIFECPGCKFLHGPAVKGMTRPIWDWNGSFERPTFTPSIVVTWDDTTGKTHVCHSFVKDGTIQFLDDCTHELRGKTVALPELGW